MNKFSSFLFYTNYRLAPVLMVVGAINNNTTSMVIGTVVLFGTSIQAALKE
jgi:hypothetical protein